MEGAARFDHCPKCRHHPLPTDQTLPAACPACGVILAKLARRDVGVAATPRLPAPRAVRPEVTGIDDDHGDDEAGGLARLLLRVPARVDSVRWWGRAALLALFVVWGVRLIGLDHRTGEMGTSFLHGPLLVFHEAGHVLFMPFGQWLTVMGGTLGQLIMPAVLCGALLLKNRDPFGASIGLWLLGASVLDVAPYLYDALHPQLTLLSGGIGEEGGHDWIYLLESMGLRSKAQALGTLTHRLGALIVLVSLGWGVWVLKRQWARIDGDVLHEEER